MSIYYILRNLANIICCYNHWIYFVNCDNNVIFIVLTLLVQFFIICNLFCLYIICIKNNFIVSLDIQATVEVDKRMEAQRLKSMDDLLKQILLGMVKNGDITKWDVTMVYYTSTQCIYYHIYVCVCTCVRERAHTVFEPIFKGLNTIENKNFDC